MTKLEELRKALEAATPGEWDACRHATPEYHPQFGVFVHEDPNDFAIVNGEGNTEFIALAHNLMPTLIKIAELLPDLVEYCENATLEGDELPECAIEGAQLMEELK